MLLALETVRYRLQSIMALLAINNLKDEDFKMVSTIHISAFRLITPFSVVGSYQCSGGK
jgi:hypothetical protein